MVEVVDKEPGDISTQEDLQQLLGYHADRTDQAQQGDDAILIEISKAIDADTAAILDGTSTRYIGDDRSKLLFERALIFVNEQSTWHHQGYLADASASYAVRLVDSIQKSHTDNDIRNLLLNLQALRELFEKLLKDLFIRPKKLLQSKLAASPVSLDVMEKTVNLILKCLSDKDVQDVLRPDSEKLDVILRTGFYNDFFQ